MPANVRYPELTVQGSPRELGRQIGEAARAQVRGFCEVALERVNRTVRISLASAMQVAGASIPLAETYAPHMVEELRGTAEAAGVTLEELMLLQVRNQLQADDAGCTSFSIGQPRRAQRVVAQNWDNDPVLDEFTLVLTRRPKGLPAFTTVTQAGLIAYIGFSDAGLGLCLNTLPAPSRRLGVPHYFLVRGIYEATTLSEAADAFRRAERAIPANVMLTTPEGPADLEITLDHVHVLTDRTGGLVTHTNHCRHPELVAINDRFPELIQSHARQARIDRLLSSVIGGATSVEALQNALRDHDGHPRSICRHANDDPQYGFWKTVFSVIIEPESRQMHITRGNPCEMPYETYRMGG
jgi:isopenicillin-N N-acyltransferase-like protein